MPELPEVETIRRGLAPLVTGRTPTSAGAHPSDRFQNAHLVVGSRIDHLDRRGKYLLFGLDDGRDLVIHLGMTGQLGVVRRDTIRDPYDRAWWDLDDGSRLTFRDVRRFGRVAVLGDDHHTLPTLAALGPEPLDDAFTPTSLTRALRSSRSRVKTQLLSQRPVAGLGNIYADEALWEARIDPASRRVTAPAAARLHAAIIDVLTAAIDRRGTTLRDYRTADGGVGDNQHHLRCYGRAGMPCLRCGEPLRRKVLDGRGTTWCTACQRR